jgi:uncharacterized membrane protein YozB (DUF420 family)
MEHAADRVVWAIIGVLLAIMVVFIGIRLAIDVPNVLSGTVPDESDFEYRYTAYAWLAYAHILPGAVYLAIAPIQLWRGFRNRHLPVHRRMGRVAIVAGITSGIFAILFGLFQSFGGVLQATAAVVFGVWFITALVTAYRAIRRKDIRTHRRWMIRAFAVGLAVGTIRLWIGLFEAFELLEYRDAFGVAFWISFVLHALVAEAWLFWRPSASGAVRRASEPIAG